ncbi:MAG: SPFH domain-containing protein, partial [Planctomycetota bacterium]
MSASDDVSEQRDSLSKDTDDGPMLRNALVCVVVAAALAFAYAVKSESSLFRAVSLQLCLSGVAVWASMDAAKIRRRLSDVAESTERVALKREAATMHYLFVSAALVAVLFFGWLSMVGQLVEVVFPRSQQQVIGGAILAVLAASLWTVFARAFKTRLSESPSQDVPSLPEATSLRVVFSESRLAALLTGGTLMAATVHPPIEGWFASLLSLWTIAVACEHLIRVFAGWFRPTTLDQNFIAPIDSILRDVFLSSINPIAAVFDIAETRFGLSLRSSWTIRFFRRSVMPIAVACLLVVWLSTCFVVIEPHQSGLEERFGVVQPVRLTPGLQTKLPWPFGDIRRYPTGIVQTMQIGFETNDAETSPIEDQERTLLWTQPHEQEFALVLGSETELVAVNAIVYFKITDDVKGLLNHALSTSNPKVALESLAYRVFMEQTRSATLTDLLSRGRDSFAKSVQDALREYAAAEKLGLEVVDVALINLHPPVEVADSYLDVINAELNSKREITDAKGIAAKQVLEAEQGSNGRIAEARQAAAKRVSFAGQESAEFAAVGEAFTAEPETYRLRLWFEAIEQVLVGRQLFVVDAELPDVIFDER